MSWQATAWASQIEDDRLTVGERFLLFSLCNYADENWSCFPGIETLAKLTGQSERTIIRQAARLEEFGYVNRQRRSASDGKRTSDRWFIQTPAEAAVRTPDQPPRQVTDCHLAPENDQVTICHVTNEGTQGDSCVTYIEEGISVENTSSVTDLDSRRKQAPDGTRPDVERMLDYLDAKIKTAALRDVPKRNKANRDAARLMLDRDKRDPHEARQVIDFIFDVDDFWVAQIGCAATLRKQYDQIRAKMRRHTGRTPAAVDDNAWMSAGSKW